jgi:peptidoglycan/xylan/chitin deacetylase (PgdA/CDA1 family)
MAIYETKEILKKIISNIPLSIYSRSLNVTLIIPYYHMVSDEQVLHTKHLYPHKTLRQFISDIDFILKYFRPISLTTLLAHINQEISLPQKSLLLTFDDGFRQNYDVVAPILLQKGVSATFFINSGFTDNINLCYQHKASLIVEHLQQKTISNAVQRRIEQLLSRNWERRDSVSSRILATEYSQRDSIDHIVEILEIDFDRYLQEYRPYLTTQQIQKMISSGFTIGAHSIDHPIYAKLTLEEQISQTTESVQFVRNIFNLNYGAFAFPHSDNGVSKQYFERVEESGLVDVSFGTSGMIEDCMPNNLQRFSLENPLLPAQNIFAYQYARKLWRSIRRNNKILRKQTELNS